MKKCRDEGLLENNVVHVRVRIPKSGAESERYTLQNCAVDANFIREKDPKLNNRRDESKEEAKEHDNGESLMAAIAETEAPKDQVDGHSTELAGQASSDVSDEDESDEDSAGDRNSNPFSALL